jgi:hypothetical protein
MDIFVQSRGHSPDFEYCWQPEVPPQLSSISSLIQSESPSVVLARSRGKLMLLTTGLESSEKKDFRDRPIRHSIFWYCNDNSYEETQIRAIAVQALRGLLSAQVDKHINLGGGNGFEISFSELKNLTESLPIEIESQRLPESEESPKIGKNSQDLRDDLAYKLQQYSLPKGYELIVIATGIKSENSLEKAGAWRSLSNLVKSENWRNSFRSEGQQSSFFGVAIAIIVAVIVVIALILLVVLLHPFSPKPGTSSPTPTTPPTQQTIEKTSQTLQPSLTTSPEPLKEELTPSANSESGSAPSEN